MWRYQIIPRWIRCSFGNLWCFLWKLIKFTLTKYNVNGPWTTDGLYYIKWYCLLNLSVHWQPHPVYPRDYSEKSITDFSLGYRLFGVHFRWYILVMGSLHSFRKLSRTSGSIVGGFFHALFSFLYFWLWHLTWEINPDLLGC